MEALSFIKFWKPTGKIRRETKTSYPISVSSSALHDPAFESDEEEELREGDDSFFELELTHPDFNKNTSEEDRNRHRAKDKTESAFFLSPTDHFSKNKVMPVDLSSKPQSPIALLKSGSKFRGFSFKKSKPTETEGTEKSASKKTETLTVTERTPNHENKGSKSLTVRFRIDDGDDPLTLARETSFRKPPKNPKPQNTDDALSEDSSSSYSSSSSRRFFSLIKPLYGKGSKKQSKENICIASPASSPSILLGKEKQKNNIPVGNKAARKHLRKSRSASAAVGAASPASLIDESMLVQQDGIQSAILHCKRSFHGSRESSLLSRCTSDSSSSREKLSTSSSEDSGLLSRIASHSASDKSDKREKINGS